MSQSEQFDKQNNGSEEIGTPIDTYRSETEEDIYRTPDISGEAVSVDAPSGEDGEEDVREVSLTSDVENTVAEYTDASSVAQQPEADLDSGTYTEVPFIGGDGAAQGMNSENPYVNPAQNNSPYGNSSYYGGGPYYNHMNGSSGYGNNPYGGQPSQGNNPYGGQSGQNNNPYGGQSGQNGNPYGGQPGQGGNPYGGQPGQNHNPYYGQPGQGNGQYGGGMPGNNQWDNRYSPYAAPVKKNNTGLIIGIVVVVIILFLIAVGALTYKVFSMYSEERHSRHNAREEYDFDDDWGRDRERYDRDYDDYDDYDYDDYGYDDYDDDEYYTLHDDIRTDLSYSVDFDYYEYETDYDNVDILVSYPIISGDDVPNLDQLNSAVQSEIDLFTEYFEEEYEEYLTEDDYFSALSTSYVTYMDEEKMSIVFSEYVYSNYYNDVFLYCINIDMENGVILDNENIINADDDFSVEFRTRSDIQNGEITYMSMMSDQEITDYFNSSNIIVFYTPKGLEIGFNYDEGWVTVTYEDYEQYLKVF